MCILNLSSGTMTTVTQEIVYSEKKRFNDYNEQRNKTNKWKKMLSNTYVYKNEKSTKINEVSKK